MTTRKRKPVLPAIRDQLATPLLHHEYTWKEADAQLRIAETIIQAADKWANTSPQTDDFGAVCEALVRALARLDKFTRRPTRRTP